MLFTYLFVYFLPSLNCSSISHDGSLVAGGFSDSSLKVVSHVVSYPSVHPMVSMLLIFSEPFLHRFGTWQSLVNRLLVVSLNNAWFV